MPRIPVILQTAETDCAAACLASLLRHKNREVSLSGVRDVLDPGRDGSSGLVLREAAALWGLELKALLCDPDELVERINELPMPFILHFSRQHYVIVESARSGRVTVMDPAVGRRRLTTEELADETSGMLMLIAGDNTPQAQQLPPPSSQHPLRLLREIISTVRGDLGWAGVLSALLAVGALALPVGTALIVDAMLGEAMEQQRWLTVGLTLAAVVGFLSFARYWVLSDLQYRLAGSLSHRVASTLFSRTMKFFEHRSVGDLVGRVESAHAIHSLLSITLLGAVLDALLTLGYIAALLVIAPPLALTTGAVVALCLAVSLWVATRCAALQREEILVNAEASTLMVDSISGIGTLRAYQAQHGALLDWQQLLDRRLQLSRARTRLSALSMALLATTAIAAPLAILLQASATEELGLFSTMTPGVALGLMGLAAATLTPVASLANQLVGAAQLRPLLDRVEDLESAAPERTGGTNPGELTGSITLEAVGFRHERHGREILSDISGTVTAGSKVCIMGPTGCGKSTLAQLLAGLADPTTGRILLDEHDLAVLDRDLVRPHIGVVFQDNWLTRGTIREAVLAGREGYSDRDIWQALVKAQLAEELISLPLGIDTRLGSAGSGLSGGQRQRLALARALLADPTILILDEPTSALDAQTERRIEQVLRDLSITRIIISHRLDVAADADQIWVMDSGQITETGTPAELASSDGWYAQLLQRRLSV